MKKTAKRQLKKLEKGMTKTKLSTQFGKRSSFSVLEQIREESKYNDSEIDFNNITAKALSESGTDDDSEDEIPFKRWNAMKVELQRECVQADVSDVWQTFEIPPLPFL